jgi:hypothetical protein
MTPPPDRAPTPQSGPNIVGLIKRDIGRAVREAAAQTDSHYFGHAALHRDLGPLRERLTLLEQRRPDLLTQIADHFDVPRTARDIATAAQGLADRLLERRYAQADPGADARISRAADTTAARRRADTAQHMRAQRSSPSRSGARMRR